MWEPGGFRARLMAVLVAIVTMGGATFAVVEGVAASPAAAQMADHATALPGTMDAMVVDAATSRVFVSLPNVSEVVALDFSGNIVGTITGEAGARGLVLLDGHLYVAAANAGAIDEIDTTTLTRTRTVASGFAGMTRMATADGALWVTPSDGKLWRVDLDGSTASYPRGVYDTNVASDAANPEHLVTWETGSPLVVSILDVSGAAPTQIATAYEISIANVNDIAVSPDGTHLVPAGGAPYQFDEINTSNLALSGVVYPANAYPTAVDMTAAGGGLFAGGINGIYDKDVYVYPLDNPSTPIATHDFGTTSQTVAPRGLRFSPDGSELFVVTASTFHVLAVPGVVSGSPATTTPPTTTPPTTTPPPPPTIKVDMAPSSLGFGGQRVGTYGLSRIATITNDGSDAETVKAIGVGGTDSSDFFGTTTCHTGQSLPAGGSCNATVYFGALGLGVRHATLVVRTADTSASIPLSGNGTEGYTLADARGGAAGFGDANVLGVAEHPLAAPVIAITPTANGAGFWLLARDGGIFSYGNAAFHGSTGAIKLNKPIVGMAATPSGKGYWLVASDGGIFAFGDAHFYGSTGGIKLNRPVVGMAATPSGKGYWLVASDGGIFAFGDAHFYGSTGNIRLARPIIGMVASATGHGYRFVANDGGVFSFGDSHFYGSAANSGSRIVGLASTPTGKGYWMVSNTGRVFRYGDAPGYGDASTRGVTDVIGIAGTAPMIPPALLGAARSAASTASGLMPLNGASAARPASMPSGGANDLIDKSDAGASPNSISSRGL